MNNKPLHTVIAAIVSFAVPLYVTMFVKADPNIWNWPWKQRAIVGCIFIFVAFVWIANIWNIDKKNDDG